MSSEPNVLKDQWGRQMDYLRIAVTDRCNLRCFYCMPAEGINYLPKKDLMTYEEILRTTAIFRDLGVNKVRITGGEPFLRRGLIEFLTELKNIRGIEKVHLTTNGLLADQYLDQLTQIGIDGINLSLDSLDAENFHRITRRNEFKKVMSCLDQLIEADIPTKINMVVMQGKNDYELADMARLTRHRNIHVRFIEEMPFNGSGNVHSKICTYQQILKILNDAFPTLKEAPTPIHDPAKRYQIEGYRGQVGIIPAYSRTFCNNCNRTRMTALGTIKNCLYDEGVLDIKTLLRNGASDQKVKSELLRMSKLKAKDGKAAEYNRTSHQIIDESMSTIGG